MYIWLPGKFNHIHFIFKIKRKVYKLDSTIYLFCSLKNDKILNSAYSFNNNNF